MRKRRGSPERGGRVPYAPATTTNHSITTGSLSRAPTMLIKKAELRRDGEERGTGSCGQHRGWRCSFSSDRIPNSLHGG